jgi:hypothetical protein
MQTKNKTAGLASPVAIVVFTSQQRCSYISLPNKTN